MARRKPNPDTQRSCAQLPAVWLSLWLLALWLVLPSRCLFAQFTPTTPLQFVIADPGGACRVNSPLRYNTLNGALWGCDNLTWTQISGGGGGGGSVTSVSVATANGLSGSVANPTTTPALTLTSTLGGDVTGGSNANTVVKLNGVALSGLATGLLKNTTATGAPSIGAAADVYGLWSGTCNSSSFLRGDGACAAAGGSGTVTSIATTSPITGGTITATGTIACATCGVTGSPLSQFASTTSSQLAGVLSDETGTGVAVFGTSPTLTTPAVTTSETLTNNGIGAVSTDGYVLTNTTAAAAGVQQQSPRIHLTGQGWKTAATAASQSTDWFIENIPVQGTINPTSALTFGASVNGGARINYLTLTGDGVNAGAALFGAGTTITAPGNITTNSGVFNVGAGWAALVGSGATTGGLALGNGHGVYWASGTTNQTASGDTSLSRSAAGIVAVGTGTQGSTAGNLYSAGLNFGSTENGANNAIACAAGCGPTLTTGMVVTIKLAHTLQAGANTFAYAGGGALNIKSHNNTANNIAAAYATGGLIQLGYDGTQWEDMSQ